MDRRFFLQASLLAGTSTLMFSSGCTGGKKKNELKYIKGSWFEFQHHNKKEGVYWNPACAAFTAQQWDQKIKEIAEIGMEYLVLLCTALDNQAYFETTIFPPSDIKCENPIEVILNAADRYEIKFFIGGGFFGDWTSPHIITDPQTRERRLQAIEELAKKYGNHKSFYGWYWPNEAYINKYFSEDFIRYVNECSQFARTLMPETHILIAPYGTRVVLPDDRYVKQLESLDVDIIAYQDEVGVRKSKVDEIGAFYEGLRKAHDRVPDVALWADMEIFEFEGDVYKSALLPAEFSRIEKQITAISPFVDTILVYQYQGMMSKPDTTVFAGHLSAARLYEDYTAWLEKNHPGALREL